MATKSLSGMTLDELKSLIDEAVDRRVQEILKPTAKGTVKEINAEIRRLRWTPSADMPSNLELIREDHQQD